MPLSSFIPSILVMAFCIIMSAYFSATETAFSSLNRTRIKVLAENGNRRAQLAYRLSENYDKLISTILIGNNLVNILVASVGTLLFVEIWGDIGATISTVVVTIVVLIFGEITPKSIAKDFPEKFAMFSAPLINILIYVLTPVNFLFTQWKKMISKLFQTKEDEKMSQEELQALDEAVGLFGTDVFRLTTEQINALLQEKTGYTLEEFTQFRWTYLPEYDCYYTEHGDTNRTTYTCTGGRREGDLFYLDSISTPYTFHTVLRWDGSRYLFVSNETDW